MAQTAKKFKLKIRGISFKNTLQVWNTVTSKFKNAMTTIEDFLFLIAGHQVGKRPSRTPLNKMESFSLFIVDGTNIYS